MALEGTYSPDTLIGGFQQDLVSEASTLKNGLSLDRGTLVAIESVGAATAAADGGNTGNGTATAVTLQSGATVGAYLITCILDSFSMPSTGTAGGGNTGNGTCSGVDVGTDTIAGTYTMECIELSTDTQMVFSVTDPNGNALEDVIGDATAYSNAHLQFTITEGGTDFALGDTFTVLSTAVASGDTFSVIDPDGNNIGNLTDGVAYSTEIGITITHGGTDWAVDDLWTVTVAAGSGHLIAALSTLHNGGENLEGILATDADASGGAVPAEIYRTGQFNITALTFSGSDDEDTWKSQGDDLNIYFRTNTAAL